MEQTNQTEAEELLRQRETEVAQREQEVMRRELRQEAAQELQGRGLPEGLCEMLDLGNRIRMAHSIESVERIFRGCVQQAVDVRLKSGAMSLEKGGARKDTSEMTDEEYYAQMRMGR